MSHRGKTGKRQICRNDEGLTPAKRRKGRPKATPAPEEEDEGWTARSVTDMKSNTIYNQRAPEAPAELFRKDLISAMKLPDSEPLNSDEYWIICDPWKQEWERGVQVPVNPDSLPQPHVSLNPNPELHSHQFKLPKLKYIRITKDEKYSSEEIHLSSVAARAEAACHYDLDNVDAAWLNILNGERALMGLSPLTEDQLERIIEELERRCWDKIQGLVKAEEGLGIEFDENVICDVCRSPDSEEGNEMVFCDSCNICVHQACYGITSIPDGSWLCRTCALSKRPECVLCPNKGGAMKCTKSGQEWAHVSCALWIPEVSIGCVEKMEPITKISNIPQSRWALICVLCRERVGACIQCSVKTCKTAYHVTCAFKHGLEMRAIIEDENADDGVKLRSYCQKHSVKKDNSRSNVSDDEDNKRKKKKDMTSEEKNLARAAKLHEIEAEFYKHVSVGDISGSAALLEVDPPAIESVYNYWKLKRRSGMNRPLLSPRSDDSDLLTRRQEQQDLDKLKMFVQLRQDLERVRNLCYMVSRREKLSRTFFRSREQTFHKQVALLSCTNTSFTQLEVSAILEANHGPSIYDKLYSNPSAQDHTDDFDRILARIQGVPARQDLNGLVKTEKQKMMYVNGTTRRKRSLFGSSTESESDSACRKDNKFSSLTRLGLKSGDSSSEDNKKNVSSCRRRRKETVYTSSSDEKWNSPRNKTLRQLEKEREREINKSSSEDSDLLPLPNTKVTRSTIYSDSDTDTDNNRDDKIHILRTKAALKEFTALPKPGKENKKQTKVAKNKKEKVKKDSELEDEEYFDKENVKLSGKKEVEIVPQRQAAKKASENLKCFQGKKEEGEEKTKEVEKDVKSKNKSKIKLKDEDEDEDMLSYVPQRQAAKKAAETIKCGLGTNTTSATTAATTVSSVVEKKKEDVKKTLEKDKVKKSVQHSPKSSSSGGSSGSSDSSSSSSSCTSSSSSSSETEEPKSDDWPFLDKEPQSDGGGKKFNKAPDKKLKTSDRRPEIEFQPPTLEREEPGKRGVGDRLAAARSRDIADNATVRKRKSSRSPVANAESQEHQRRHQAPAKSLSSPAKKTSKEVESQRRSPRGSNSVRESEVVREKDKDVPVKRKPGRPRKDSCKSTLDVETEKKEIVAEKEVKVKEVTEKLEEKVKEKVVVVEKEELKVENENNNDDDKLNKVKPMPKCKKKELGLLDDEKKTSENTIDVISDIQVNISDLSEVKDSSTVFSLTSDLEHQDGDAKKVTSRTSSLGDSSYQHRSIFSPQVPKDNLADIFDFENDILAVDETVHEEQRPSLPLFNFNNEFLFKEDSKEDSKRETYNLVEKLRMEYAKKTCGQQDMIDDVPEEVVKDEKEPCGDMIVQSSVEQQQPSDNQQTTPTTPAQVTGTETTPPHQEISSPGVVQKPLQDIQNYQNVEGKSRVETSPNNIIQKQQTGFVEHSPATNVYQQSECFDRFYEPCPPVQHDANKLPVPQGQEKLERSGASDERWVPPSTQQSVYPSPGDSPYTHQVRNQWTDNEVLPSRRSSASSVTSSESSPHDRTQDSSQQQQQQQTQQEQQPDFSQELHNKLVDSSKHCDVLQFHQNLAAAVAAAAAAAAKNPIPHGQDLFHPVLPSYLTDNTPYHPYSEASPFVGPVPVAMFPNTPYTTPSASIFPPPPPPPPPFVPPFTPHSLLALPKQMEEQVTPCGAAFTSSQHNMALTTAMVVSPPPVTPLTPDHNSFQVAPATPVTAPATPAPTVTPIQSPRTPLANTQNKKQAAKPTRMSARVISQAKSPGKSPRQQETPTPTRVREPPVKRNRNTSNSQKGGRGKGRGGNKGRNTGYDDFVVRTKLTGTVYDMDFDEESECDGVENLRAMRERRRSTDVHHVQEKKLHHQTTTSAASSPSVVHQHHQQVTATDSTKQQDQQIAQTFPDVAPLLPGPVDMRTYLEPAQNSAEYQNHLLGAFANPAEAAAHVHEFDEEMEKELHSALTASRTTVQSSPGRGVTPPLSAAHPVFVTGQTSDHVEVSEPSSKVSLSDSRNQLKVKIKGPFLDANYAASNTTLPVAQPTVSVVGPAVSGTSNLRRMRKKELLRHWTQDMNMDDPMPPVTPTAAAAAAPPPSRTMITIPKAVASMTSIPTREDYKALIDANSDKKKKKKDKPNSVNVRELIFPPLDDEPGTPERRGSTGSNASLSLDGVTPKRRARISKPSQPAPPPKLKIKFGGNDVQAVEDKKNLRIRPPKKRPCDIIMPSFEELKRESMKYRKKIMQDFDEDEKTQVKVKVKTKKKKRKTKDGPRSVQLVEDNFTPAPKIIIKFGKSDGVKEKLTVAPTPRTQHDTDGRCDAPPPPPPPLSNTTLDDVDPLAIDPLELPTPPAVDNTRQQLPDVVTLEPDCVSPLRKVRTSKPTLTPIRLKLSRCEEGYVMSGKENDNLQTDNCNTVTNTECPVR